jgi:hypothetical protein
MKRALLVATALFVFVWLVPKSEAKTYKCILPNSCTPPPCEFFAKLKINKAIERALLKSRARYSSSRAAFRRTWKEIEAELYKTKYPSCGPGPVSPGFDVNDAPKCEIGRGSGAAFKPLSLDDALRNDSTCSEIVEADFAWAKERQDNCQFFADASRETAANVRGRSIVEYQAKNDSLQRSLLQYLSSCKPDAKTARQIANMGLSRLLRAGQKARGETLGKWVGSQNALGAAGGGVRP